MRGDDGGREGDEEVPAGLRHRDNRSWKTRYGKKEPSRRGRSLGVGRNRKLREAGEVMS